MKESASVVAKVLLYPLETTKCWKIGCKSLTRVKKHVFWIVVLCGWVIPPWHFEEMYCLHLLGYKSVVWLITLRMKAVHSFKSLGRNYLTTRSASSTIGWWKPQISVFILCFFIVISTLFTVFCWCMTDFLWKNELIKVFIIFECQSPWIYNNTTFQEKQREMGILFCTEFWYLEF